MQKMDKAALKARVCEIIRERNAEIVELGHAIFAEPELGFKEVKTAEKVKQAFEKLGIAELPAIIEMKKGTMARSAKPASIDDVKNFVA